MSSEQTTSLNARFEKVFANGKSEPDDSGGVSTIDKIRSNTKAELGRVAATIAEGTAYGAYDPSSGRITSSLDKPTPIPISQKPNEPPNKRRAAASKSVTATKPSGSTSAPPAKKAPPSELDLYRAARRLDNYKRLFKKRSMKLPPFDDNKPVDACRICEEELKIMATPDLGDRILLGSIARVEALITARPEIEAKIPIRGFTQAVHSELDTYLRDDLDELYIKYDAALAMSVEFRVFWRLADIGIRVAARNTYSTPLSRRTGEQYVDPEGFGGDEEQGSRADGC